MDFGTSGRDDAEPVLPLALWMTRRPRPLLLPPRPRLFPLSRFPRSMRHLPMLHYPRRATRRPIIPPPRCIVPILPLFLSIVPAWTNGKRPTWWRATSAVLATQRWCRNRVPTQWGWFRGVRKSCALAGATTRSCSATRVLKATRQSRSVLEKTSRVRWQARFARRVVLRCCEAVRLKVGAPPARACKT